MPRAVGSHLSLWLSFRIPLDSSIQKGNIRQRQQCLESQKQNNQEIPNLKLSPCVRSEETKSQVK
jgi:polypeptide N-acetylgalactosaminyltransferase